MDFSALLQQAQKLTHETQVSDDLPRVERTLPQVLQATQELHSRVSQTGAQDMQAHILLGHKGIDLPKISQKLETLSSRKTFEPLDPISTTDIQSFLRNEKENAILSVIEEVHKNSYQAAQNQKWEHTMNDWKLEKVKLMNALIGPSQNWIDIRKGPEQTILNESTFGGRSSLNNQEMAYAREVYEYNKLVNEGAMRPSLVQRFAQVAESFNDSKVNDIWEIMKYMTNVTPSPRTQDPLRARCTQTQFIEQAKRYLENRYKLFMQTVISEHLRDAQRGGIPSVLNLVGSFVGLKFANQNNSTFIGLQDGHVEGKPLWPMVYYCLRCGDINSALKCMQMAGPGHDDFIAILEEKCRKPGQKINPKLELQIRMQYKRQIRNAIDPYKRAVYCIIGCCDIQEQHPEVAKSSDDFLWIQLSLIRPESDENSEHLTYSALQAMILEQYGEKHFNANDQPHLYYQVLALTGQFEAGIEFLARFDKYRAHAVHIALAMSELHMIGGPRNLQEPLLSVDIEDPQPMRRLNIARLIMLYVKKFEITDPAEALQYFFFLRNLRDTEGRNLFLVCVSDLAIECRDFDLLFGKMQRDGIRSRGLIDQFESSHIDAKMACEMIAEEFVKKGMFEDAIKLFDLAGNHEQALRYTSILLSQVVHQPSKAGSLRERLQRMALEFTERYAGAEKNCDPQTWSTFSLLKELVIFFDHYHNRNYQPALEVLERIKLVPLKMADLEACVHNFKRLGGEVCKVIPDLLLATMDIAYNKYKVLKGKDDLNELKLKCMGDQQAALVGQMCLSAGQLTCNVDEGSFLLFNTAQEIIDSDNGLLSTVAFKLGPKAKTFYALEGAIPHAGNTLSWLHDNLQLQSDSNHNGSLTQSFLGDPGGPSALLSSVCSMSSSFGALQSEANKFKNPNYEVILVPAFSGYYTPYWRYKARGMLFGLTLQTTAQQILFSAYEAICFQVREVLEALTKDCRTWPAITKLVAGGDLSEKPFLMQILADLCGVSIERPQTSTPACLGTMLAAGLAMEILTLDEFRACCIPPTDQYSPALNSSHRDMKFRKWKIAVDRCLNFDSVSETDLSKFQQEELDPEYSVRCSIPGGIYIISSFALIVLAQILQQSRSAS